MVLMRSGVTRGVAHYANNMLDETVTHSDNCTLIISIIFCTSNYVRTIVLYDIFINYN